MGAVGLAAPDDLTDEPAVLAAAARAHLREKFLRAKVGVSGANFAVAETGTLVVVESEGNGRMCLTLPEVLDLRGRHREGRADVGGPGSLAAPASSLLDRRADEPLHVDLVGRHPRRRPAGGARRAPRQRPHQRARRRGRPPGAALHPLLGLPQRLPGLRAHRRARLRLGLPRPDRRDPQPAAQGRRRGRRRSTRCPTRPRCAAPASRSARCSSTSPRCWSTSARRSSTPTAAACPSVEELAFKGAAVALSDSRKLGFGERFTRRRARASRAGSAPSKWTGARDLPARAARSPSAPGGSAPTEAPMSARDDILGRVRRGARRRRARVRRAAGSRGSRRSPTWSATSPSGSRTTGPSSCAARPPTSPPRWRPPLPGRRAGRRTRRAVGRGARRRRGRRLHGVRARRVRRRGDRGPGRHRRDRHDRAGPRPGPGTPGDLARARPARLHRAHRPGRRRTCPTRCRCSTRPGAHLDQRSVGHQRHRARPGRGRARPADAARADRRRSRS